MSEGEKVRAIECLLKAEPDLRPAAFSGATRLDVSQLFAPATANLAALYAISYLYEGRFEHASAVALRGANASAADRNGFYVTKPDAIHRAYAAYRAWFAHVKRMGIAGARQAGLSPLAGTELAWY